MSRSRKIIAICLVIAGIALILQVVDVIISRETIFTPGIFTTGILPIALGISLFLLKKNDDDKK